MLLLGLLIKNVEQILKTRLVLGLCLNLAGDLILQVLEPGLVWVDLILIVE